MSRREFVGLAAIYLGAIALGAAGGITDTRDDEEDGEPPEGSER